MEKHEKHADAARFAEEHPLSKSAGVDKKFNWAQRVCEFLNANYDDETVRAIRLDCACGPELGKGKKIREIYEKETDLTVFAEKVNRLNQGVFHGIRRGSTVSDLSAVLLLLCEKNGQAPACGMVLLLGGLYQKNVCVHMRKKSSGRIA